MPVIAEGVGRDGERRIGRWSLVARDGCGPSVPSAAAAAVLHALVEDRMQRVGAGPCVELVDLDDILLELAHLPLATRLEGWTQERAELFPAVLGDSFDALPASVRQVHGGRLQKLSGRAVSAASGLGALAGRWLLGLPHRGRQAVEVEMAHAGAHETWTRRFGASRFRSRLALVKGGARPIRRAVRAGDISLQRPLRCSRLSLDRPGLASRAGCDAAMARPRDPGARFRPGGRLSFQRARRPSVARRHRRLRRTAGSALS